MISMGVPPSQYVYLALEALCLNGDVSVAEDCLFKKCTEQQKNLSYWDFKNDLNAQIRLGCIYCEGSRLYIAKVWRYEESAAQSLVDIIHQPALQPIPLPEVLQVNDITLCEEQRNAVEMALRFRLSLILGGAGSGKSTLIQAIVKVLNSERNTVLCAPTGKAARNLTSRTGLTSRTVHSALGLHANEDFLAPVRWETVDLVIVDEASMLTLEMMAGILHRVPASCRVVLLGDPNQLLSVGAGNVLPDLLELGAPCYRLFSNHRQANAPSSLLHNVVNFHNLQSCCDLRYDENFRLIDTKREHIKDAVIAEAVARYFAGESVQVLSPFNQVTDLSVAELNHAIRDAVNPMTPQYLSISLGTNHFRQGDRVMITKNDRERDCSNGDIGVLHISRAHKTDAVFSVQLPDGRCPQWEGNKHLINLTLAYALTIHKSQGSEYDTVLLPITCDMQRMLNRNLFYTAISRAKKQVLLFGDPSAIDTAMTKLLPPRRSNLVAKTRMQLFQRVG